LLGVSLAYDDLRQWIAALEKAGELKRVAAEVDPILEIAEITDRVSKSGAGASAGGPARRCSSTSSGRHAAWAWRWR
jgi:hypothetical protein